MPDDAVHDDEAFLRAWLPAQPAVGAWLLAHGVARQDCEDLLQEVALAAHRAFPTYDSTRPFVAWVLGIARHKLADDRRARQATFWSLLDDEARAELEEATIAMGRQGDARLWAMQECLERIEPSAQELIQRFYVHNQTVRAIGEGLRMSVANVKVRLHRIRQALRRCVDGRLGEEPS